MDAGQFNFNAEKMFKDLSNMKGDVLSNIKNLSEQAQKIAEGNNPVEREFEFQVSKHKVVGRIHKDGQITLLSRSNGVVEEIIKRLRDDRHT